MQLRGTADSLTNPGVICEGVATLAAYDVVFHHAGTLATGPRQGVVMDTRFATTVIKRGWIDSDWAAITISSNFGGKAGVLTIVNSGILSQGTTIQSGETRATVFLDNSGTILTRNTANTAYQAAYQGVDAIVNSGWIIGEVQLRGGKDRFVSTATGRVDGVVWGGRRRRPVAGR